MVMSPPVAGIVVVLDGLGIWAGGPMAPARIVPWAKSAAGRKAIAADIVSVANTLH